LCLENNKHILCEKPFAINNQEAYKVIELARRKNLFCMEAMWSRFMPIIEQAKLITQSGEIGDVTMFVASFGKLKKFDPSNNVYKKELGGGCLLDLGVYPISLSIHFLGVPSESRGFLSLGKTGVDEQVSIILKYERGEQAVLTASFNANLANNIKIYGTKGVITVHEPMYRASKLTVNKYSYEVKLWKKIIGKVRERYLGKTQWIHVKGNGYNYEADEVVKCLRQGEIESAKMSWDDTLNVLHIVDEIRSQTKRV
jgi:predicted dehydrogenase